MWGDPRRPRGGEEPLERTSQAARSEVEPTGGCGAEVTAALGRRGHRWVALGRLGPPAAETNSRLSAAALGPGSLEPPAWSQQPGAPSLEPAVWSQQPGPPSLDPPAWSQQPGASSLDPPAWSQQPGASSLDPASSLQPPAQSSPIPHCRRLGQGLFTWVGPLSPTKT
ncbi:unnamed protein product [Boreogadus saida]